MAAGVEVHGSVQWTGAEGRVETQADSVELVIVKAPTRSR
jgi:hypothetical protein